MRRFVSLVLALFMAASVCEFSYAKESPFTDVPVSRWSYDSIIYAVENGYMNGVGNGKFNPSGKLNRAMVVTVLWRAEGEPETGFEGSYPSVFSDLKDEAEWFSDAVVWAAENGVVNGYEDGTFRPKADITREQLAAVLYRYSSFRHYYLKSGADLSSFEDCGDIHSYAAGAMEWAYTSGLVSGISEKILKPRGYATREQFAAILERYMNPSLEYSLPSAHSYHTEKEYERVTDADFYVSPDGNDSDGGSFEKPFATFERARDAVRELKETKPGQIKVAFKAGEYTGQNIFLDGRDSGTEGSPVVYCAYGDGEVSFIGGIKVSLEDFTPLEEKDRYLFSDKSIDKIMKADLSDFPCSDSIDARSEVFTYEAGRLMAARYPNKDIDGSKEQYYPMAKMIDYSHVSFDRLARTKRYHTWDGAFLIGCVGHEYWNCVMEVTGYDADTGYVSFTTPTQYGLNEYGEVIICNISEELDNDFEYYIDPETKTLYVYNPCSDCLVSANDSFGTIDGADHIEFRGICFDVCKDNGFVINSDGVKFEGCRLFGIGGRMAFRYTGTDLVMNDCDIEYMAGGGIWFDSGKSVDDLVPTGPYLDNCSVHHVGQKHKNLQNPAIRLKCAVGAVVSHNEIYNTACSAISYGYVAEGGSERAIDCIFEYNLIYDVDRDVVDIGCIYSGRSIVNRDNIFRYNIIHSIPGAGGKFAIYLDDGLACQQIYGNLFYNFTDNAIEHSGGSYMKIHDNIFIKTSGKKEEYSSVVAWAKYYNFRYDEDEEYPTAWNSGNFRILYKTKDLIPGEDSEYRQLWAERWPELYKINYDYDDVEDPYCITTPAFCEIYNNYSIGQCEIWIDEGVAKFASRIENNPYYGLDENPFFANPALGDYRITGTSDFDFPFEKIGRY